MSVEVICNSTFEGHCAIDMRSKEPETFSTGSREREGRWKILLYSASHLVQATENSSDRLSRLLFSDNGHFDPKYPQSDILVRMDMLENHGL